MTDPLNISPRRLSAQVGPALWSAGEVAPNEAMIALGAEHGAELEAARLAAEGGGPAPPTPRLDAVLADLSGRLAHGRGFALLRGLPEPGDAEAALRWLAERLGEPVAPAPARGSRHTEACDVLLLRAPASLPVGVRSAAFAHNALLRADRAGLAALYEARGEPAVPVFSNAGGAFAGRWDDAALPAGDLPAALDAAMGEALVLGLRAGDILALNPFLAWADRIPGALAAAAVTEPSSLDSGGFAALR